MNYADFVSSKLGTVPSTGIVGDLALPESLFGFQEALTRWAARRGRAAIFADTGLGKMRMELAWADAVNRYTGMPLMIHTPLAVAAQLAVEAAKIGVRATVCREASDLTDGINIANYERLHKFDASIFGGVVLDESGCIKHHDTKTFQALTAAYHDTPFKLPATATPAPNDWTELGTHAEFLGICTRAEMLAEFFTHDGGDTSVWRLKGHARSIFWRWVATWGAMIRKPSNLGFDDGAYNLPPLHLHQHHVDFEMPLNGMLFAAEAQTLSERREARKASLEDRVRECAAMVNADGAEPWVVWCDLNAEGDALTRAIDGAVQISGADDVDTKERRLIDFAEGRIRVLVSKPSICGWGLNWQHARRMAFVGVTDSYEAYYQAVRRCWRFGQTKDVHVHIFASKAEGAVVTNLKRKEREAGLMADSLSAETCEAVMAEVTGSVRNTNTHAAALPVAVPSFLEAA
ncbi:helicase-related protein [Variovorax sp. PMC12]|uniref:helicase-related protein n=1 Tax=Variovorax sp. PMC12 TaxID=2126319 RepID=UPI000D11D44C|nr:DEAD/DEAH box helicase [Variovorax sp. PMC12]AVQ81681.1 helicase [Variovorax sp. PMC12]